MKFQNGGKVKQMTSKTQKVHSAIVELIFIFNVFTLSNAQSSTCSAPDGTDLSPLTIPLGGTYYSASSSTSGNMYNWNICGVVTDEYCQSITGTVVCQFSSGSQYSCGLLNTQTISIGLFVCLF